MSFSVVTTLVLTRRQLVMDTPHPVRAQASLCHFADVISASLMKNIFWTNCHECTCFPLPRAGSRACILTALEGLTNARKCVLLAQCSLLVLLARLLMQVCRRKGQDSATGFKSVTQPLCVTWHSRSSQNFTHLLITWGPY